MHDVGFLIGALFPTLLLSRLFLWLTRKWDGGVVRLLAVHGTSLLVVAFAGGVGMADGGAFAGIDAGKSYFLPQALWLTVDLVLHFWRSRSPRRL